MKSRQEPIDRRAFLWTALAAGLAAVCSEWWARRRVAAALAPAPFPIPGAAALPAGAATRFEIPGTTTSGVLVRLNPDSYVAFDQRCPHLGCPVLWSEARARFECPCHKAVFDAASGRVLSGPPPSGLRRIAIERRGDAVWTRPSRDDDDDDSDERSA